MIDDNPNITYHSFLDDLAITYGEDKYYLSVGEPSCPHGWILHISLRVSISPKQLSKIINTLIRYGFPFKMIKNKKIHDTLNTGGLGDVKTGKFITVFLDDTEKINSIIKCLIPLTENHSGPFVITDFPIRPSIYVRYGSFTKEIEKDPLGNLIITMKDNVGNKMEDYYRIPPIIPLGAVNHFLEFIDRDKVKNRSHWIGSKVLPIKLLKKDVKGNVWSGIYIGPRLKIKICVIKQGIKGMFEDLNGRDMFDRLESQKYVLRSIKNIVRTPHLIDSFIEGRKSYIILSYIWFGRNLIDIIRNKLGNIVWHKQPINKRQAALNYYIKVLDQIKLLHEAGFIHRDITGTNFFIDIFGRVHLIDLELSYSLKENRPSPPHRGGTYGYMSPRQANEVTPTPKDDAYSLGALLLMIVAGGIEPTAFLEPNTSLVTEKIQFLTKDKNLTNIIVKCLQSNSSERPNVTEIKMSLTNYKIKSLKYSTATPTHPRKISDDQLKETLIKGSESLQGPIYSLNSLWLSQKENGYSIDVYPLIDSHTFGALYRGISGSIYFFSILEKCGIKISNNQTHIDTGINFLLTSLANSNANIDPSYYFGLAGIALGLKNALESGFLKETKETFNLIEECFTKKSTDVGLATGAAGQIISAIQCNEILCSEYIKNYIKVTVDELIDKQSPNGPWTKNSLQLHQNSITLGLGYGIAGVAYTLLEYGQRFDDSKAILSAQKGFFYLEKTKLKKKSNIGWPINAKSTVIGHEPIHGSPGIILSFLRAYEITNHKPYLTIAEKALHTVHPFLIYTNLTQALGMAGVGEIYLEAFRITKNQKWIDRATWIVDCLLTLKMTTKDGDVFWLSNPPNSPTADLMIGTTGILHFLLRYLNQEKVNFPLLLTPYKKTQNSQKKTDD